MKRPSLKALQEEMIENRSYHNGYQDGYYTGRTTGRQEGIQIGQKNLAQALLSSAAAPSITVLAELIHAPIDLVESWALKPPEKPRNPDSKESL